MAEFARMVGLSVTTVSRALNDSPRVRPTTRRRVQQLAQELGYRPSAAARSLVQQEHRGIGIVFTASAISPESAGEPMAQILFAYQNLLIAIASELEQRSYLLVMAMEHEPLWPGAAGARLPLAIREAHVGGLIVAGDVWPELYEEIRKVRLPCVAIDAPPLEHVATVSVDEVKGVELAVDYLCELGHSRIAYLNIPARTGFRPLERPRGYFRALTRHGLPPLPGWDVHDNWPRVLPGLMELRPRSTALLCFDDTEAMGVVRWLAEHDVAVPRDVSVVSLGDQNVGGLFMPTITRVSNPYVEMATRAIEELVEQLGGEREHFEPVRFDPSIVVGESTGPCCCRRDC